MFVGIFGPRRPKPVFRVGQFVEIQVSWSQLKHYMLIEKLHWMKPGSVSQECWTYGGPILRLQNDKLTRSTVGYFVREEVLTALPNLD